MQDFVWALQEWRNRHISEWLEMARSVPYSDTPQSAAASPGPSTQPHNPHPHGMITLRMCHMLARVGILALTCATCSAQIVTPKWLDARAKYWAERLHLQDWETHITIVGKDKLENGLVAQSGWDNGRKLFTIFLLDPNDWMEAAKHLPMLRARTPQAIRRETDESICHEFVHLRLAGLGSTGKDEEEAVVVRITAALMRKGQL